MVERVSIVKCDCSGLSLKGMNAFRKDDVLNNEFSQGEFSLDQGERLLQGMQSLREELNTFGDQVQTLCARAQEIYPLKQRKQPVTRPLTVVAICNYKQSNVSFFFYMLYRNTNFCLF